MNDVNFMESRNLEPLMEISVETEAMSREPANELGSFAADSTLC